MSMATPDGISTDDWDVVHELAVALVNAADPQENARCRERLFEYLDQLEQRYGQTPSILATRADFVDGDDDSVREPLYNRAYELATVRSDWTNALLVAHSLAELYIEDRHDVVNGRLWLARLKEHLAQVDDPDTAQGYGRLVHDLMKLDGISGTDVGS
jgi:hypothetical protein